MAHLTNWMNAKEIHVQWELVIEGVLHSQLMSLLNIGPRMWDETQIMWGQCVSVKPTVSNQYCLCAEISFIDLLFHRCCVWLCRKRIKSIWCGWRTLASVTSLRGTSVSRANIPSCCITTITSKWTIMLPAFYSQWFCCVASQFHRKCVSTQSQCLGLKQELPNSLWEECKNEEHREMSSINGV